MDNESPDSWFFTEGGVYVGGGSRGALGHGGDHDDREGEGGAVGLENQQMDIFAHSSELHCVVVASNASPLGGDHQMTNEVISILHICHIYRHSPHILDMFAC